MNKLSTRDVATASVIRGSNQMENMEIQGRYTAVCLDANGNEKWSESWDNLVTTQGRNWLLDVTLIAGTAGTGVSPANMYFRMSLITSGTPVAGDAYAVHAGFVELASSVVATRGSPTFSAAAAGVKATTTAVSFSVIGTGTITGAAINVLNAAAVGNLGNVVDTATVGAVLYSAGIFAGAKSVTSGDTLNVSYSTTLT
jgi:hypothetical protein